MRTGITRRFRRSGRFATTAVSLFACASAFAITGAPAQAATGHKFLSQLTEAGGTHLSSPEALAVDAAGDVFVADSGAGVVDVYEPSGALKTQFGGGALHEIPALAVDQVSGEVYVDIGSEIEVFKASGSGYALLSTWTGAGTPAHEFSAITGVAVDGSSGRVYVADLGNEVVDVLGVRPAGPEEAAEGEFKETLKGAPEEPSAVAVDLKTHRVYVAEEEGPSGKGLIEGFSAAGKPEAKITGSTTPTKEFKPVALSVDPTNGDIYASEIENETGTQNVVNQFSEAGKWVGWLTSTTTNATSFDEPRAVTVAPSGDVYVADLGDGVVDVFGPSLTVPSVQSGKASNYERGTAPTFKATLSGTIEPGGEEATYHFEYAEETQFEQTHHFTASTSTVSAGSGSAPVKVTAVAEGLKSGTSYVFRIVGESANKVPSDGLTVIEKFTTPEAVGVVTGAASAIQPTSATLEGSLEPEGLPTKYDFEYGATAAYGKSTAVQETSAAKGSVAATSAVTLTPNTTYHFRLVASNAYGTSSGDDATFTTSGPPRITGEPSQGLSHTEETLKAQVNPDKLATKYHFEYGETSAYSTSTPAGELPAGEAPAPVSATLTGLKLATTYHFRLVAENSAGTTDGPDEEFTTVLIDSESATQVTGESATVQAQINPLGLETTCHFEYGESTSYGTSTPVPDTNLGAAVGDQLVSQAIAGLRPGTTYHYRVVATVQGLGSAPGPDRTFTTAGAAGSSVPPLPDGRQYEMVSPPQKHGAYVRAIDKIGGAIQAAEDGSALGYVVDGAVTEDAEGNRSPLPQEVLATRSNTGWSSQELVTPQDRTLGPGSYYSEYRIFSPDLSVALVQPLNLAQTPLSEPPLSPPVSEAERRPCPGSSTESAQCQEKTIYLREDAPIVPGPAQAGIYEHAKKNGEQLAAERGQTSAEPGYVPLVTAANVLAGTKFGGSQNESLVHTLQNQLNTLDASPDLTHVVIASAAPLVAPKPSTETAAGELYEWNADGSASGGSLQLVSVLPSGAPLETAEPELGATPGIRGLKQGSNYRHAISNDGSRIVWTSNEANEPEGFNGLGHIYLRDTAKQETLQLDLPAVGSLDGEPGKAQFQIASSDDSRVFFTDTQRLTSDSTAAPHETQQGKPVPARPDLYECEVGEENGKLACTGGLQDLSVAQNPGENGAVQGLVLGAAEDGSDVYFVADGVLAQGAVPGDCRAFGQEKPPPAGATCNLYVAQRGPGGWSTRFIARLSSEDAPDFFDPNIPTYYLVNKTARVSPSGEYLAFMSNRRLTGYDNTDVNEKEGQPGEGTRHADEEVFLYDAAPGAPDGGLSCVSCNPSGARPRGVYDTQLAGEGAGLLVDGVKTWEALSNPGVDHWLAGNLPGWTTLQLFDGIYQSRYLSDKGRLFFNSADALTSAAAGATRKETIGGEEAAVGVENVYEYEPQAVGNCAQEGGCVALLSGGTSDRESAFLDASVSGNDVFFATSASLLPQDVDSERDIYDARVCGEAGCLAPGTAASEGCTEATSCKPGSVSPPTFQEPPSSVLSGSGNVPSTTPLKSGTLPSKTSKPLTRRQKLALALRKCRKLTHKTRAQKHRRAKCEAQAKRRYGTRTSKQSSSKHKGSGKR